MTFSILSFMERGPIHPIFLLLLMLLIGVFSAVSSIRVFYFLMRFEFALDKSFFSSEAVLDKLEDEEEQLFEDSYLVNKLCYSPKLSNKACFLYTEVELLD